MLRRARAASAVALVALALTGCIQSVHSSSAAHTAPPGDEFRVIEATAGRGSVVRAGDLITVDLVGTYGDGSEWGRGPFTYIYADDAYPGAAAPVRVGSVFKFEWIRETAERRGRQIDMPGVHTETQFYRIRRDRGPILLEHRVRKWCRPMKIFFLNTGFGPIEFSLGCWRYPRLGGGSAAGGMDPRTAALERALGLAEEPPVPATPGEGLRPAPDADAVAGAARGVLNDAVSLAMPERVGELLRAGADPEARDSIGMTALLRAAFTQYPGTPFVPQDEVRFEAVVDTLLAHGALVASRAERGAKSPMFGPEDLVIGATALDFAARFCADGIVTRLLAAGADPRASAGPNSGFMGAVMEGCPEVVRAMLEAGAPVEMATDAGGSPLERLVAVSAYHEGHLAVAQALISAGARSVRAKERLRDRLRDKGTGGFGFSNRPLARRILALM